ncbi:hypothetical protein [Bandra megavirus]|uniref:Uncharacterized protein n=1 Tax=Bandra megavirus TaxID=2071566 RepID=A0A2K9V7X5_9VIRU|nr:hypothetical protein [Bandra megavirus]
MNYQYINNNANNYNQINNMDYLSLVNMLTLQINPENRKMILERLTEMNNQLLYKNDSNTMAEYTNVDLSRSSQINSRKKDVQENLHPSMNYYNNKGINPLPLNIPMNSAHQYNIEQPNTNYMNINHKSSAKINNKNYSDEIDLDSIINNFDDNDNIPDALDIKLAKIKKLHTKIITDNKNKRKNKLR